MEFIEELSRIANQLSEQAAKLDASELERLMSAAELVGKSFCGSWLGYHSRVYYRDLQPVPPGAHFSKEWGLFDDCAIQSTVGDWVEYDFDAVEDAIYQIVGNIDLDPFSVGSNAARETFEECKSNLQSILAVVQQERRDDTIISDLATHVKKSKISTATDYAKFLVPSGQQFSRDMPAIQAGFMTPPHINVKVRICALRSPFIECEKMCKLARRAVSHIQITKIKSRGGEQMGTKVFIGHGRSRIWKDLKDFIQDRLQLPWDEFNRVPIAGVTNVTRLSTMLNEAVVAFLIMTAEDERTDGKIQARMNVIHEVGLFQGRLGFEKAIILLEEGCDEFTNINGLGQIRFPQGDIGAVFEEVRRVLEREGLVE